jgi:hypothetical protein
MSLLFLLASAAVIPADDGPTKPVPLRYVRSADDKIVTESEVTTTRDGDDTVIVSRTQRPDETMTLTLRQDKDGQLLSAEAVRESGKMKKTATLTVQGKTAQLKQGGITDFLKGGGELIVTSAPDWSDVFQLVRRYDAKKGGEQQFAGVWIHPDNPPQELTFTITNDDVETVKVKDKEVRLGRYKVKLRSGDYIVWADAAKRVVKLTAVGPKAKPVVLEGFEDLLTAP